MWKGDISTPDLEARDRVGIGPFDVPPMGSASCPLIYIAYLLPCLRYSASSKSISARPPVWPETMTITVLEAIASSSGQNYWNTATTRKITNLPDPMRSWRLSRSYHIGRQHMHRWPVDKASFHTMDSSPWDTSASVQCWSSQGSRYEPSDKFRNEQAAKEIANYPTTRTTVRSAQSPLGWGPISHFYSRSLTPANAASYPARG